jgi:DNA invertase Pin-like site-specific DNA recombinase
MTPYRAAIYARVSTVDQNCELQLKELRECATGQKWSVVAEYIDSISGAKASRPALNRLMEAAAR